MSGEALFRVDRQRRLESRDGVGEILPLLPRGLVPPRGAQVVLRPGPIGGEALFRTDGQRRGVGRNGLVDVFALVPRGLLSPRDAQVVLRRGRFGRERSRADGQHHELLAHAASASRSCALQQAPSKVRFSRLWSSGEHVFHVDPRRNSLRKND